MAESHPRWTESASQGGVQWLWGTVRAKNCWSQPSLLPHLIINLWRRRRWWWYDGVFYFDSSHQCRWVLGTHDWLCDFSEGSLGLAGSAETFSTVSLTSEGRCGESWVHFPSLPEWDSTPRTLPSYLQSTVAGQMREKKRMNLWKRDLDAARPSCRGLSLMVRDLGCAWRRKKPMQQVSIDWETTNIFHWGRKQVH